MDAVNLVAGFEVMDPVNLSAGIDWPAALRAFVAGPSVDYGKGPVADGEGPGGFEGFFDFAGYSDCVIIRHRFSPVLVFRRNAAVNL